MTTFARATFNTASYASFRPTYPRQLFDYVFKYHERNKLARWNTAVDLGCGTGASLYPLNFFLKLCSNSVIFRSGNGGADPV